MLLLAALLAIAPQPRASELPRLPIAAVRQRANDRAAAASGAGFSAIARAADSLVAVAGRITTANDSPDESRLSVYIEDETGGIRLYAPALKDAVRPGDSVVATGVPGLYHGAPELRAVAYQVVPAPRRMVQPLAIAVRALGSSAVAGRLITTRGRVALAGRLDSGHYLVLQDPSSARALATVVVLSATGLDELLEPYEAGDRVQITGVVVRAGGTADAIPGAHRADSLAIPALPRPYLIVHPRTSADVVHLGVSEAAYHWALAALAAIVLLAATWVASLRSQVRRQTGRLRESEERYRALVELAPDGILVHRDSRVLFANDAAARLFGAARPDELVGRPVLDLVAPESRAEVMERIQRLKAANATVPLREEQLLRLDGVVVPADIAASSLPFGDANAVQVVVRDASARHEAEAALRRSEAELRALVMALPDVIMVLGRDGRYLKIAPSAVHLLYRPPEQLLGKRVHDVLPPDAADFIVAHVRRALDEQRRVELEYTLEIAGRTVWFQGVVSPLPDDAVLWVGRDITSHKHAQEALAESRALLATAEEVAHVASWSFDVATGALAWSDEFFRILGLAPGSVELSREWFRTRVHPDDRAALRAAFEGLATGERVPPAEFRIERPDGEERIIQARGRRQRDGHGAIVRVVGSVQDVTEHVAAERALRQAHGTVSTILDTAPVAIAAVDDQSRVTRWNPAAERLFGWSAEEVLGTRLPTLPDDKQEEFARLRRAEQAGIRTEAFQTVRRRKDGSLVDVFISAAALHDGTGAVNGAVALFLDVTERRRLEEQLRQSQKLEAVGLLAGGVAHDFNNLLTVIRVNCELLAAQLERRDTPCEELGEIRAAADRAAGLTRQLLAFSRKQIFQPRVLDASTVVSGIAPMLRRLLGEDIEIALHSAGGCRVLADPGQLEQVLVNLSVNARDAMPNGGRLTIATQLVELDDEYAVRHEMVVPGQYVMLSVSDTGHGMDRATRERIFEPFFTTKELGHGTGLGLATVYGIVRQSGGYIWVYSEPGQGTTFKIYLPREAAELSTACPAPAPPVPRGSEVILLVEDEDSVRTLARRVLARQGYHVLEARHGADAVQVLATAAVRVDLVITDIVMPAMGGRELAERLRPEHRGLRVLYMSGYTDDEIFRRGELEAGSAFLQKPFTAGDLARTVRRVLDAQPAGEHRASSP